MEFKNRCRSVVAALQPAQAFSNTAVELIVAVVEAPGASISAPA
jgi:hypothetical protein